MKPDHRNALQLALNRGVADVDRSTDWAFYNASPLPEPDDNWRQAFSCWQANRSEFLRLTEHGYTATHELTTISERSGNAAFLLGRNRLWNQWMIARAWNRLEKGGQLIVSGNKTDGIGPLRKWLSQHVEIAGSFSKYHAVVLWADKTHDLPIDEVCLSRTVDGYEMAEGLFSASGPDSGSRLLVEHFNDRIRGKVADLCVFRCIRPVIPTLSAHQIC